MLRSPRSSAKAISRLGELNYFSSYIPLLHVVSKPIQDMTSSGTFSWTSLHQECWETIKLLCVLNFQTHVIDQTRPLYVATDASQISIACIIFQIDTEGKMVMIATDSRILKASDRSKPAAWRELLGLVYSLVLMDSEIKTHHSSVLVRLHIAFVTFPPANGKFSSNGTFNFYQFFHKSYN